MNDSLYIRRTPHVIERELEAARHHYNAIRDVVAEFIAFEPPRPFVLLPDGSIEYEREIEIPEIMRTALRDAAQTVAELTRELHGLD